MIQTKLLLKCTDRQFIGLGFGSIAASTADAVCVSAFAENRFTPNSAVGALDALFHGQVSARWSNLSRRPGECHVIDTSDLCPHGSGSKFKSIFIVSMGQCGDFVRDGEMFSLLETGLQHVTTLLRDRPHIAQLDLSALGTQYGGIRRRECFDMVTSCVRRIFEVSPAMSSVRFVTNHVDTFVELFESIYRLQNWVGKELRIGTKLNPHDADILGKALQRIPFDADTDRTASVALHRDVNSALRLLDENPRAVLLLCRAIVEGVVKSLALQYLGSSGPFGDDARKLYEQKRLPVQINSFIHTCRVLGNFANHDPQNFQPAFRDAELVMLLTLRIAEWFFESNSASSPEVTKTALS